MHRSDRDPELDRLLAVTEGAHHARACRLHGLIARDPRDVGRAAVAVHPPVDPTLHLGAKGDHHGVVLVVVSTSA